jgi:hypothetical protein
VADSQCIMIHANSEDSQRDEFLFFLHNYLVYNVSRWENKFQCHMRSYKVIASGHSGGCSLFTPICVLIPYKNGKISK